jgi:formylglycine-generating enzyme required for sulfatase activity
MALFAQDRTGLEFVLVPAGSFSMGSPGDEPGRDGDERRHRVTLTRPYLLSRTECTQSAWDRVGGNDARKRRGESLPIEGVTWLDADAWCRKAGLTLPTEAQWEAACRGGTATRWCCGEDAGLLSDFAWFGSDADPATNPAGKKRANAFGLCDMHGNVWEWCAEWYGDYPDATATDPSGPQAGVARVARGGATFDPARRTRSADRGRNDPMSRNVSLGFRPARTLSIE